MPDHQYSRVRTGKIIAIRFHLKAETEDVVYDLFDAARRSDLSLRAVFADGHRAFPVQGEGLTRGASRWRAELSSPPGAPWWHLGVFMACVIQFLESGGVPLKGGVTLAVSKKSER